MDEKVLIAIVTTVAVLAGLGAFSSDSAAESDSSIGSTDYNHYYHDSIRNDNVKRIYSAISGLSGDETSIKIDLDVSLLSQKNYPTTAEQRNQLNGEVIGWYNQAIAALYLENYWIYRINLDTATYSIHYDGSDNKIIGCDITVSFDVIESYPTQSIANEELHNAIVQAQQQIDSTSILSTVTGIHDYVCNLLSYAKPNEHTAEMDSVYTALVGNHEVVCQGYARTFKMLCDEFSIPCVIVFGKGTQWTTSELHMWNEVRMEDGKWYLVDCTWDDNAANGSIYLLSGVYSSTHCDTIVQTSHVSFLSEYGFLEPTLSRFSYGYIVEQGSCGENLIWERGDDEAIYISGTGKMIDYSESNTPPWGKNVRKVLVFNGVESIGEYAFTNCDSLEIVEFADSVTTIGQMAFYKTGISYVILSEYIEHIGKGAFSACRNLSYIVVNENNSKFCTDSGLLYSKDLSTLYLYPAGLHMDSVELLDTLIHVQELAFSYTINLKLISVRESNPYLASIEGLLYEKNTKTLLVCPSGFLNESIYLPEETQAISGYAFSGCLNIKSIYIPSIKTIGANAVSDCEGINEISFGADISQIQTNSFEGFVFYDKAGQELPVNADNLSNRRFIKTDHAFIENNKVQIRYIYGIDKQQDIICQFGDTIEPIESPGDYISGHYKYQFLNWSGLPPESVARLDSVITAEYQCIALEYTVTFCDSLKTVSVTYSAENINQFTEPDVSEKEYYYASWEPYVLEYSDITVNAIYTPHMFKASFLNEGIIVHEESVGYACPIPLPDIDPVKEQDAYVYYVFQEWKGYHPGMVMGSSDISFDANYRSYAIQHKDYSGTGKLVIPDEETYITKALLSQISGSEGVIVIACPDCIITVDSINLNNLVTGDTVIFSEKTSTEYIRSEADTRVIGAYRTVVESEAPLDLTVSVQIELSSIGSPTMNGLRVMLVSDGSYSKELSYTLKDNTISINVPSNQLFALVQAAPSSVGNDYGNLVIVSSSLAIMIIALLILSVSRKT